MLAFWKPLRWLVKGGLLFSITLMLAIALSSVLAQPNEGTGPEISQSPLPSSSSATEVKPQTKYERTLVHYATVSRNDGSFRNMFIAADSLDTLSADESLPDDTLIVMETWYTPTSPGSVFIKQKREGEWQYGSFNPSQPDYRLSAGGSCHSCHAPFPQTDFTLTLPLLNEALRTRQVQMAFCDRPGRTPCNSDAYRPSHS